MTFATRLTLGMLISTAVFAAHAQSRGPAAQYWIDLSTNHMSIPGMPAGGGLFGGMLGGAGNSGGKSLEAELYVRAKPAGVEGRHAIPSGMNMGEALLLMPIKPAQGGGVDAAPSGSEREQRPRGRILVYWGCGETVRAGQPKVLDLAKANYGEFAQFFASRGSAGKGVRHKPGDAYWPNQRDRQPVPDAASLQGEHAVSGDGVPASLKFSVPSAHDFLPKAQLAARGAPADSVEAEWQAMQHAKAYFLHAQGASGSGENGHDMIFWSSSEKPDMGWSLMTYQSPAQIASLLQQKVILPPGATHCEIPKGIFEKADGAMLSMIAYGPELNVSHPARPLKAPANWQPEWTARVRVKSTGMTMLGMQGETDGRADSAPQDDGDNAGGSMPQPLNILKGIFGR